MDLTLDQALRILQVIAIAASAGLNVYLFYRTRNTTQQREHRKAMDKIEHERRDGDAKLHARIDKVSGEHIGLASKLARRLSIVETTITHLPTHKDLTGIREELADLNSNVAAVGERSASNNQMLHTIHSHLLKSES